MIRLRCWLPLFGTSALALALAACGSTTPPGKSGAGGAPSSTAPAGPAQIGAPLYVKADMPPAPAASATPEPIVIQQATITFEDRIQLAAQVDGLVELIASPLPAPAKLAPGDSSLVAHPRKPSELYRKLRENDPIVMNQYLVRLDDSEIVIQLQALTASFEAAKGRKTASEKVVGEARKVFEAYQSAGGNKVETANSAAAWARSEESLAEAIINMVKLEGELAAARKKAEYFSLRSTVDGRVYKILKNPGEYVKAGETILEVQNTARFKVQGTLDVQDASRLQLQQPVIVEPTRPIGPEPYTIRHRQSVSSLAVSAHDGRPLVVSAGLDASVLVWDIARTRQVHPLPHPAGVAVKAVATTTALSAKHLAATGSADGKVRIWDLSNPDKLPGTPLAEMDEAHSGGVTFLSFSPDGKSLVSAAGRDVYIWDIAGKKKRYALPLDHKDDVTAARFTPQCTLATVSRDKTIRIWRLGQDGAALEKMLDNRSGVVELLGLSADGGRILFDQDPSRMDVVLLGDGRTVGSLYNTGGSLRFAGLALFSPDDELILTAGSDADSRGELQLWEKPASNGRGSERRRLVTPGRSAVTCAAFSPDAKNRFVVVGTQAGGVHYWYPPAPGEMNKSWPGKIIAIQKADSRTATIRVEVDNPGGRGADWLQDRGLATIIVDPMAKPQ